MARFSRKDRIGLQTGARDLIRPGDVEDVDRAGEAAELLQAAGAVKGQPIVLRRESARVIQLEPVQEGDVRRHIFDARQDERCRVRALAQHARRHVRLDGVRPLPVPGKLAQQVIVQHDAIQVINRCWRFGAGPHIDRQACRAVGQRREGEGNRPVIGAGSCAQNQ